MFGGGFTEMLFPLVITGFLFYFLLIRPEKRKQSDHRNMLESLKKNDRVVTIGGIKGVVAGVRREADEITIKVDENSKLKVTMGSIARVERDETPGEK